MTPFSALYYPSWDPPVKWLRSMLLFMDRIEVIRPKDVEPRYDPANAAVFEIIGPHAFGEIKKAKYDLELDGPKRELLRRSFAAIAEQARTSGSDLELTIDHDGRFVTMDGYTLLHGSKTNMYVRKLLGEYGLVDSVRTKIALELGASEGFEAVNADASCLILGSSGKNGMR